MKNNQQNIPFLKTKIGLVISFLVSVFLVLGLIGFLERLSISNKNKKQELAKLEFYEEEKSKIESRLLEIETEEGIEKTVRENYNLARDGESVVVIVEEEESEEDSERKQFGGFFDFFRNIFKKNR